MWHQFTSLRTLCDVVMCEVYAQLLIADLKFLQNLRETLSPDDLTGDYSAIKQVPEFCIDDPELVGEICTLSNAFFLSGATVTF